ncbi:unnamed protein product [Pleuronectes platessa]|uniref:Uncharacterized protein n=1 Tax=Pleuronectes platessa TaxID=8262 RepID=A0A9N7UKH4_PLEPL|nr:unnamed protein product [Pleuronectes platessa]
MERDDCGTGSPLTEWNPETVQSDTREMDLVSRMCGDRLDRLGHRLLDRLVSTSCRPTAALLLTNKLPSVECT